MYYISSIKGNKYGVTDTKDGVEEFYTFSEIVDFVDKLNIPIKGVELGYVKGDISNVKIDVVPFAGTPRGIKSLFLNGYVADVENGSLKKLVVQSNLDPNAEIVVDVGSICSSVANYAFYVQFPIRASVIIKFSDRVSHVGKLAFKNLTTDQHIQLDFRDVKDERLINDLYRAFACSFDGVLTKSGAVRGNIIDSSRRYGLYTVYCKLFEHAHLRYDLTKEEDDFIISHGKATLLRYIPSKAVLDVARLHRWNNNWASDVDFNEHLYKLNALVRMGDVIENWVRNPLFMTYHPWMVCCACGARQGRISTVMEYLTKGGADRDVLHAFDKFFRDALVLCTQEWKKLPRRSV